MQEDRPRLLWHVPGLVLPPARFCRPASTPCLLPLPLPSEKLDPDRKSGLFPMVPTVAVYFYAVSSEVKIITRSLLRRATRSGSVQERGGTE